MALDRIKRHIANNVWNKKKGFAQAQVIYSFGRSDQLDVDALKRLIKSMSRFLSPEDAITCGIPKAYSLNFCFLGD
jgi:hypothetical protein